MAKTVRPDPRKSSGPAPARKSGPAPAGSAEAGQGLDEVERAMSVLDGRHPEHHRVARETRAAVDEKAARAEREAADARARAKMRLVIMASGAVAAVAVAVVVLGLVRRSNKTADLLARASAPWEAKGFAIVASSGLTSGARLEASPDPGCMVAVSTDDGALTVERGGARTEGRGSIGWCACDKEPIVVTTALPAGTAGGIRLLRIAGGAIGGARLFPLAEPRPAIVGSGGGECAEANLDDFIASGPHHPDPVDDRSLEGAGPRAALRRAGFHVVAAASASAPFVIATLPQGSCAIAETTAPTDALVLRAAGGAHVLGARGALAWCDAAGGPYTVWREGSGELRVLAAPSKRLGGMLGLREAATSAHLPALAAWTRPEARGADAADALRASFVADVVVSPDGNIAIGTTTDKRIVSISREPDAELIVTSPPAGYYLCTPALDPGVTHALCIESAPHVWRPRGDAKIGLAYAPLPFWMSAFLSIHEPDALSGALALVGVARHLGADGFAPTILGSATEVPRGVDVLGRAGEDAVVAVGLQPKPPWLLAYTNGRPWDLAGDPLVIPLAPFAHALLTTDPPPSAPKESRRTVVFRRAAKP